MLRYFTFWILALAVSLASAQGLQGSLDSLVHSSPVLRGGETGICVYDRTTSTYLYRYRDTKNTRPASNEKLLTCVAGLDLLGPTHPFTTTLYCDRYDNLYVEGGFDPEFGDEDMNRLVNAVHDAGIHKLRGYLFGDVSLTDGNYWGSGWAWDDAAYSFQPYMSPLMFNKGCVDVMATPRRDGGINVTFYPASSYFQIVYSPGEGKFDISRDWKNNSNVIYATGTTDKPVKLDINVYSSRDYFMHTFAHRLLQSGVRARHINKMLRDSVPFEYVKRPASQVLALKSVSHSLAEVVTKCLKNSDNLNAEAIMCHYACHALNKNKGITAADGVAALTDFVAKKLHLNPGDYRIADGSGLSPYNQLSPYFLVEVLKYASRIASFRTFYDALPIAGVDGTLSGRMRGTRAENNVRAKTGTINGISTLSGYVTAANGHQLAFSIMNQNITDSKAAKAFEDEVCVLLSNWR